MFGPYRIEALIGRGGMGEVYRAFDVRRDRVVALKRLRPDAAHDAEFQARFRAEAAIAARLHEPHVIPIHDFGQIDGQLFIDMRLVEGRDLGEVLAAEGRLAPQRAVHILDQVCSALEEAHQAGLVHRDIKPANILVSRGHTGDTRIGEFAYVADFGIARSVASSASLTATGAMIGSLHYMSPERFSGWAIDRRADVYALGCVLFELLTGRRPFATDNVPALIGAHLNQPPPRPTESVPGLSPQFDGVVAVAMAKDPAARFSSAAAFAAAARAALDPLRRPSAAVPSTMVGPPTPMPLPGHAPAPPARRPRRWTAVLVAALLLVALAGAGWWFLGGRGDQSSSALLQPVRTPGDNPFMPAIGDDRPGVTPPASSGGTFSGDTAGLYGGTLNNASCDPQKLVTFLAAHPPLAAAWAGVQGIGTDRIPAYVATLTPVILRSDVSVLNHGFKGGAATEFPAVLQAGTAVLVDPYGVPRARCYCGNPLSATKRTVSTFTGPSWPAFASGAVTAVQPAPSALTRLTLYDLETGRALTRPVGTAGAQDDEPGSTPTVASTPLYQLPHTSDAIGASGDRADPAITGVPGGGNTGFWVGCEGVPARTRFTAGGQYGRFTTTVRFATFAPAGLAVHVQVLGDGAVLTDLTLQPGQQAPVDVAVRGVQELTIAAQAVTGTCTTAPVGYGVAVDALLAS